MNEYTETNEEVLTPEPQPEVQPQVTPAPQQKRSAGYSLRVLVAVALCCSILGGALGGWCFSLAQPAQTITEDDTPDIDTDDTDDTEANISYILQGRRENSVIETVEIESGQLLTAAQVYAANVNSTVGITTSITTNYWGYQTTSAASGSGFIITDDGYILTNFHVIEDADSITVSLYSGKSYTAELIGYDESNDIAVLKVEAEGLTPVVLGDSDNLNVGDSVVAIGNPLGELTFSLTAGTISAKDREVTMSSGVTMNLLQTDCAINSGNSGGALFNMYGEVIGITNAKYSSSSSSEASIDNIGFAIPINSVLSIVKNIIEYGYIVKPYIGISVYDVSAESQRFGIPAGAAVYSVTEDGPAQEAGLQAGDVITHVDGTAVTSSTLGTLIGACQVGDELTLTVYRQGQTLEITLTVGKQHQSALPDTSSSTSQWGGRS